MPNGHKRIPKVGSKIGQILNKPSKNYHIRNETVVVQLL